jgi:mono/diheme cytochrome c family protein
MKRSVMELKGNAAVLIGGAMIVGAFAGGVRAQIHPDAKTGKEIAEKLCSGCHIVGAATAGATAKADVPSFAEIANKPDQTTETIAGRIVVPHPPMPNIQLTREEIGDVAAYILTLRK